MLRRLRDLLGDAHVRLSHFRFGWIGLSTHGWYSLDIDEDVSNPSPL